MDEWKDDDPSVANVFVSESADSGDWKDDPSVETSTFFEE